MNHLFVEGAVPRGDTHGSLPKTVSLQTGEQIWEWGAWPEQKAFKLRSKGGEASPGHVGREGRSILRLGNSLCKGPEAGPQDVFETMKDSGWPKPRGGMLGVRWSGQKPQGLTGPAEMLGLYLSP